MSDDGAGLNRSKLLSKAKQSGLLLRDEMSDQDVWALIMEPGFSTAEVVTDVSGRGVGMDVVKLEGSVLVMTTNGYGKLKGETFRIAHMGDCSMPELKEVLGYIDEFLNK